MSDGAGPGPGDDDDGVPEAGRQPPPGARDPGGQASPAGSAPAGHGPAAGPAAGGQAAAGGPAPGGGGLVSACIVLGVAVSVFGVSFGVLATATGLSVAQTCAMSLLVFTGASQFTAVAVVASGGSPAAALGSALLLAARNGAYGMAVARFVPLPRRRLLAAHLVIDETTAMALAQATPGERARAFWMTGAAVFGFWNLATLLGALGGSFISDPHALGLDAAFPAAFVYLLWPHLQRMEGRVVAALGAAIALVAVPLAPPGVPVLAASLAALVGLLPPRRRAVERAA